MKVLFVNNFKAPDYQNDIVYHGLVEKGYEVYETSYPSYMLSSYPDPKSLYGKGFTVFAKLTHTPNVDSAETIIDKLRSKFYDIVVYGSVHRDLTYLNEVTTNYPQDRVYFVDGEDHPTCIEELKQKGVYLKRECIDSTSKPITFAIPESQIIKHSPDKLKDFATVIPGDKTTYIFDSEEDYYADYAQSYYGATTKKAGWDCMRHYEILANRCVPYFIDLENCPARTLVLFPKDLILESNRYVKQGQIPSDYSKLNEELFNHTVAKLTTTKLVEYLL